METQVKFNISYDDLLKIHKKNKDFDKAYEPLLNVKDPWQDIDKVVDFVRRWDQRVPVGRNKDKIMNTLRSLKDKFSLLNGIELECFNCQPANLDLTEKIFKSLSEIKLRTSNRVIHLGSIGASKLMHAMNKCLFVMWDNGICKHYGVYPNEKGYLRFMETMQAVAINILKEHKKVEISKETNRTLAKLLDKYNWINFSTSKMGLN